MKNYTVLIPVIAHFTIKVKAENKEDAAELALNKAEEMSLKEADANAIDYGEEPFVMDEDGNEAKE